MLKTVSVTIRRRRAGAGAARIARLQGVGVGVGVAHDLGPRQAAAVDEAGVVELVREDHVAAPDERRDRADVGLEAGREHQRVLGSP